MCAKETYDTEEAGNERVNVAFSGRLVTARFFSICLKSQPSVSTSIGRLHLKLSARCEYRPPIVQSIIKKFYRFGLTRMMCDN